MTGIQSALFSAFLYVLYFAAQAVRHAPSSNFIYIFKRRRAVSMPLIPTAAALPSSDVLYHVTFLD